MNDDLISRHAVLDILTYKWNLYLYADDAIDAMQANIDKIKALPSVTAEQTVNAIPMSVIKDIKTDIRREYKKREYAGDAFEMGTAYGLNGALQIIENYLGRGDANE